MRTLIIKCDWCGKELEVYDLHYMMEQIQPKFKVETEELCETCHAKFWEKAYEIQSKIIKDAKEETKKSLQH